MAGISEKHVPEGSARDSGQAKRRLPSLGWLILVLTAVMSVTWSAHKLLEQDEIFSLQTDRVPTFGEVLRIQKLYPISLEPPPFHVLAHTAMNVLGPTAFALRLPALFGYLLMQFCLFFFVRNLVGRGKAAERAGLVAMAIPALTWTLYYSAEGRPYGVLLGSYAAAVLCWQIACKRNDADEVRYWPLLGLAASLALTLTVHFYGVLLILVLCLAELVRTLTRHSLDRGMLTALGIGTASLLTTLPYIKASSEFRKHYYAGPVSMHMLTQPYRQMLLDYTSFPKHIQTLLAVLLFATGLAVVWGALQVARRGEIAAARAEWVILISLVLLPVFAFVLGKAVTHALEVRHSIGAIVGLSSLIAIALVPFLRQDRVFAVILSLMLAGCVAINGWRIHSSIVSDREAMSALALPASLTTTIDSMADRNIYFQNLGKWETASLYEPDPDLRSRLVLVYSRDEEMAYEHHDTMYLTATHTMNFSPQKIMAYDDVRKMPGEHIFATFTGSGWDWTGAAFAQEAAQVDTLGKGFGGSIVKVRFKQ